MQTTSHDLLYQIFFHTLPSRIGFAEDFPIDLDRIEPINLSMVCHSWRAVVTSQPSLWSQIDFVYSPRSSPTYPRIFSKFLQFSQDSPLNISMELRPLWDTDKQAADRLIQETFSQHSRLKNLKLGILPLIRYLSSATLLFSPSLVSLDLNFQHTCVHPPLLDFTICSTSNTLRSLDVSGGTLWILPECVDSGLHFPSLSILNFATDITGKLEDVHTVLSSCPNIERMKVVVYICTLSKSRQTPEHSTSSPHNIIVFRRLAYLTIVIENIPTVLQVLNWITCPALRNFKIRDSDYKGTRGPDERQLTTEIVETLGDFMERSCPPLETLGVLYNPYVRLDEIDSFGPLIRNLLRPLRTLESLTLEGVLVDNELFEEMTLLGDEENQFTSTI